ncbi:hypothetical protein [uncultured Desulfobacter sp.]|uniref:type IV toxin-antitoxin system AbiEi family antitoxin domain-containing protein n=1 Tax=uncultured Desulfobacter sp. TaxID=240139 RepID=UPI0029F4840A|nr:hypothetical protein [uncultured Desulfobacter sp.]
MATIPLTKAMAEKIEGLNQSVITEYTLGLLLHELYLTKRHRGRRISRIQKQMPDRTDLQKNIKKLYDANILSSFKNMSAVHRIFGKKIDNEEEIVCSIDPFAYISHLSAMEYHGLTDKIPRVLFYSAPDTKTWREFALDKMKRDFKGTINESLPKLSLINMKKVGKKNLIKYNSVHSGSYINVKNTPLRVSSIGRTFLDMIRKPDLCGGIYNVLEAYEDYSNQYLNLIIDEIDRHGKKIEKVRAGYILEERLSIEDRRIEEWKIFAQRGGSRKLDPNNDYYPDYSEEWCISINIDE